MTPFLPVIERRSDTDTGQLLTHVWAFQMTAQSPADDLAIWEMPSLKRAALILHDIGRRHDPD